MSVIDNLNAASTAPATGASNPMTQLDQNAFLRLMTTQLTTQDPFNPVDNTQMIAQMAQFSQVAGIAEMNRSLQSIVDSLAGSRFGDVSNWIGRSMLVESEVATPLRDGSYAGEIELAGSADAVTVSLVDENGSIVRSIDLGSRPAGPVGFAWDGLDDSGQPAGGGPLQVVVTARAGGQPVAAGISTWTSIGGIQSPANGGATRLVTGLGLLAPDAALRLA